ncbi:MAG: HNH endonuclease [Thermodesulfobacteriota bacterium]
MRPVRRGKSPQPHDFDPYRAAFPHLVSRLGNYCSYCERRIVSGLHVEHIQPKDGAHGHPHLIGRWENFLLACKNCNSTKKDKRVALADVLLPDRDNTFVAFAYSPDGAVGPSDGLPNTITAMAEATLALTGLEKRPDIRLDEQDRPLAIERTSQRMEAWLVAEEAKKDVDGNPENDAVRRAVVRTAMGYGFFSVWMTVFRQDPEMRTRLVDAFEGTAASSCFHPVTTLPVSPAPNPDGLANGGKL